MTYVSLEVAVVIERATRWNVLKRELSFRPANAAHALFVRRHHRTLREQSRTLDQRLANDWPMIDVNQTRTSIFERHENT